MQKKKARKGFLFLRRESVLPPCRAGPVCPAGTNAVFCGGTHGSRPTDRCGKPSVGDGVPTSRQRGRLGERKTRDVSPSVSASRCHLPRRGRLWSSAPLDKPAGMGIIINRRGRCDKRSAPCKIGNLRIRNRHLAEWRFRLFSFCILIETE